MFTPKLSKLIYALLGPFIMKISLNFALFNEA